MSSMLFFFDTKKKMKKTSKIFDTFSEEEWFVNLWQRHKHTRFWCLCTIKWATHVASVGVEPTTFGLWFRRSNHWTSALFDTSVSINDEAKRNTGKPRNEAYKSIVSFCQCAVVWRKNIDTPHSFYIQASSDARASLKVLIPWKR